MPTSSMPISPGATARWLIALLLASAGSVGARTLTLDVERLLDARVNAESLHLQVVDGAGAALAISAQQVTIAPLGLSGRMDWSCALARDATGALACSGAVRLRDGKREQVADLAARVVDRHVELSLSRDGSQVMVGLPLDTPAPIAATLHRVPVAWLARPLAAFWPAGELRAGTIDVSASLPHEGGFDADYAGDGLVFNTSDGAVSGNGIAVRGHVTTTPIDAATRVGASARFSAGVLRAGAMRVEFPATGVDTVIDARAAADGNWEVARFAWRDPDALEFEAAGVLDTTALAPLRSLAVTHANLAFPLAKQRYAAPLFAAYGVAGLELDGRVEGSAQVDGSGLRRLVLRTRGLNLRDRTHGLRVEALTGDLDWLAAGEGEATWLGWRKADIAGAAVGTVNSRWQSRDGVLRLLTPLRARLFNGRVELRETRLDPFAAGGANASTTFALRDLGYDSSDGTLAVAHVSADGEVHFKTGADGLRVRMQAQLNGGEALLGPVYAKFPDAGIASAADLTIAGDRWQVARFDWNDPGVLEFSASGELQPLAPSPLPSLQLDLRRARLATALPRYASSWLSTRGYGQLGADGDISGSMALVDGKPQRFVLRADQVTARDGGGRFAIDGLDGGIDWDLAADRPATTLAWRSIELLGIPLGAARARLQSRDTSIMLAEPLAVDVLGGQVKLERFSAQPRSPRGDRYAGSFALAGIEMARVSEAFGWPRFPGKLSGGIPEIEFVGDRIELHGGLDLYVFDGHLGMSGLALERPFGVAPSLGADVHFENLDLQQVTSAFSFGSISGHLFGTIGALRLVDWSPVAFDAWLRTDGGGRMSYKAVNDLTAIGGGGGLSASLQTMALKVFDTFGYRRLGIRCRLRDDVCAMGGIEPLPAATAGGHSSADGYTIVEGSGLPRIVIVGHRPSVDWPTLVRRLQEATKGQGPVIE